MIEGRRLRRVERSVREVRVDLRLVGAERFLVGRARIGVPRGQRTHRRRPRVARRIGDDIADRYPERAVHRVRHFIARHELAAGRVPGDDDVREVRKGLLVCQLSENLIHEVERRNRRIGRGHPARPPRVAPVGPHDLVRRRFVGVGDEMRRDDERIVERAGEKRRGGRRREVVIRVPSGAVHHDERAREPRIRHVERVRRIHHRSRRTTAERDPLLAGRGRRRTGCGRRGSGGANRCTRAEQRERGNGDRRSHGSDDGGWARPDGTRIAR